MTAYILRRLALLVPVVLGIVTVVFLVVHLIPGDPAMAMAGDKASAADIEAIRHGLGLDRPLYEQYLVYLGRTAHLEFGRSIRTARPVRDELAQFFGATVELAVAGLLLGVLLGVPAGVISATRQYSLLDYASMVGALFGISMPIFWIGLMLIYYLGFKLGWFPLSGAVDTNVTPHPVTHAYVLDSLIDFDLPALRNTLWHLTLPALALSSVPMAVVARMSRSSMLEVLRLDYLQTARAKGLRERSVLLAHALKNALIPVVTVIGLQFGSLLSGAVLTETVFGRPGVGTYVVQAITARDYPVVQGTVLIVSVFFVLINLVVDVTYAYLDPRIRYG